MQGLVLCCTVYFAALVAWARSELTDLSWHAQENLFSETSLVLATQGGKVRGCEMSPSFTTATHFYVMRCVRAVYAVQFYPQGDYIYSHGQVVDRLHPLWVDIPTAKTATLVHLHACKSKMKGHDRGVGCAQYHIDLFRIGGDADTLALLSVNGKKPIAMKPSFDPSVRSYTSSVEIYTPFTITAVSRDPAGGVGIEWLGDSSADNGGLGHQAGCYDRGQLPRNADWSVTGPKATGYYRYRICAKAGDMRSEDIVFYNLTVKSTRVYSAKLKNLSVGEWTRYLSPPFDPDRQDYLVTVPETLGTVLVKAQAEDQQAAITFLVDERRQNNSVDGEVPRGRSQVEVTLPDNSKLKIGQTPIWIKTLSIKVKSADDREERHYMLTIKEHVSHYADLEDIRIGDETNCKLTPKFHANITEYTCTWWWEDEKDNKEKKIGALIPYMHPHKCKECQLLSTDYAINSHFHLSWHAGSETRYKWRSGKKWQRKFLYGEYHRIPFQVLSANHYTSKTYWVTLKRDCPWYMQTWLTRLIARSATYTAIFMAATSITNVMALAKQVQFMSLTCEIDGVPPVYKDFAESLKTWNFDAFDYIPFERFGIPTKKTLVQMKANAIKDLKQKLGIEHATLLLQYCEARRLKSPSIGNGQYDFLYPNAILERVPSHSRSLIKHMKAHLARKKRQQELREKARNNTKKDRSGDEDDEQKKERRLSEKFLMASKRLPENSLDSKEAIVFKGKREGPSFALRGLAKIHELASARSFDWTAIPWDEELTDDAGGQESTSDDFEPRSIARRLGDSPHWSKKLNWEDEDYDDLMDIIMNRTGFKHLSEHAAHEKLRKKWPPISCAEKQIELVEDGLLLVHQLLDIRKLLSTTTGTFMILSIMIVVLGGTYFWIWWSCIRARQKRLRIIEPYPLLIFVMDYALISFSKSASKVAFHPKEVHIFGWSPPPSQVSGSCLVGLVGYPIAFVGFVMYQVNMIITRHRMVWNPDFEKYTDPRCSNIKVVMPPDAIPAFVPILPQMCTWQVRSCIPVLDVEGNELQFGETKSASAKKREDIAAQGNPTQLMKKYESQLVRELSTLQAEIDAEHQNNIQEHKAITNDFKDRQHKLGELQKQKTFMDAVARTESDHIQALDNAKAEEVTHEKPPWMDVVGDMHPASDPPEVKSLTSYTDEMVSAKKRSDLERLDSEERYAMIQWIDQNIRDETKLQKYCIMRVFAHNGSLVPKEPVKGNGFFEDQKTESRADAKMNMKRTSSNLTNANLWMMAKEDYLVPETPWDEEKKAEDRGHKPVAESDPELVNFAPSTLHHDEGPEETKFIENEIGQRLVFTGTDGLLQARGGYSFWNDTLFIPGGGYGGSCKWMDEPDTGWEKWVVEEKERIQTVCYADKWQWLYLNEPEPWYDDDDGEADLNLCCFTLKKQEVFFWKEYSKWKANKWAHRVPFRVLGAEKVEMRQWLWNNLLEKALLKLKIAWMADQNPKFYQIRSQVDIMDTSFHNIWHQVTTAEPNEAYKKLLQDRSLGVRDELLEYTLMKVEDTYAFDEEELWMLSVDPAKEEEVRVQFDTQHFWLTSHEPDLHDLRDQSPLVPKTGYYTSPYFLSQPEKPVGMKRYTLFKPDGSSAKVELNVRMKHIIPLMKYTNGFKCNVPMESLDMPFRDNYNLILGNAKKNEENNYVIERLTSLVAIIALAKDLGGALCSIVFLSTKSMSWLNTWYLSFRSSRDEEGAGEEETEKATEKARARKCRAIVQRLIAAFLEAETLNLFLQVCTLSFLTAGQYGFPAPLCAMFCIVICSLNMLLMNVKTFGRQFEEGLQDAQDKYAAAIKYGRMMYAKFLNFLNGDNIFRYQFVAIDQKVDTEKYADSITMVVSELGIAFDGAPDIAPGLPPEEVRKSSLLKKIVHYIMEIEDPEDNRFRSARDHPRYETDIAGSLYVAVDRDQMMMRKNLPQIMATIQCVNHGESKLCGPQFDSYLTLTKQLPDGEWEEDWDEDRDKVDALLESWNAQVQDWLNHQLGAVENEKTATRRIKFDIANLLKNECSEKTGQANRDMYKFRVSSINVATKGTYKCTDLHGKLGYVRVLYDIENIPSNFPRDRMTAFGRFTRRNTKGEAVEKKKSKIPFLNKLKTMDTEYYVLELSSNTLNVQLPVGVTDVRFVVMLQDTRKVGAQEINFEEVVGFTDDVDMIHLVKENAKHLDEDGWPLQPEEMLIYSKWSRTLNTLEPYGGVQKSKEQMKRELDKMSKIESGKSWMQKLKDMFVKCFHKCMSCTCFAHEITEEEKVQYYGRIECCARHYTEVENEDDAVVVRAIKEITEGESAMNLDKIMRHKDRWQALAGFFGLKSNREDLEELKEHIQVLEKVQVEMAKAKAEYLNTQMAKGSGAFYDTITKLMSEMAEIERKIEQTLAPYTQGMQQENLATQKTGGAGGVLESLVRKGERKKTRKSTLSGASQGASLAQALSSLTIEKSNSDMTDNTGMVMSKRSSWDPNPSSTHSFHTVDQQPEKGKEGEAKLKQAKKKVEKLEVHLEKRKKKYNQLVSKPKGAILRQYQLRRTLEDEDECDNAIIRLKEQIAGREKHLKALEEQDIKPKRIHELHEIHLGGSIVKKLQGVSWAEWCCLGKKDDSKAHDEDGSDFAYNLLGQLRKYQTERLESGKQVLHYVIISDQLKPSKMWRPDAIMPHVAMITARDFEDIDGKEVKLVFDQKKKSLKGSPTCAFSKGVTFEKETHLVTRSPVLVNGRLSFICKEKATVDEETGHVNFCEAGDTVMYLYWDGKRRWVISPIKGDPPPYGFSKEEVKGFLWAADTSMTPDRIVRPWHVWIMAAETESPWRPDHSLKVLGPSGKLGGNKKQAKSKVDRQVLSKAGQGASGFCTEIINLVKWETGFAQDPEKRDCLVSLTSESVQFAWKDDMIERLAPFRRFILSEFGNYNRAWFHMTRQKTFSKARGFSNLRTIFKESFDSLKREVARLDEDEAEQYQEQEKQAQLTRQASREQKKKGRLSRAGSLMSKASGQEDAGEAAWQPAGSQATEVSDKDWQLAASQASYMTRAGGGSQKRHSEASTASWKDAGTLETAAEGGFEGSGTLATAPTAGFEGGGTLATATTVHFGATETRNMPADDEDYAVRGGSGSKTSLVSDTGAGIGADFAEDGAEEAAFNMQSKTTSRSTVHSRRSVRTLNRGKSNETIRQSIATTLDETFLATHEDTSENKVDGSSLRRLHEYLEANMDLSEETDPGNEFDKLAKIVMDAMDKDGGVVMPGGVDTAADGLISVGEVIDLYEAKPILVGNLPVDMGENVEAKLMNYMDSLLTEVGKVQSCFLVCEKSKKACHGYAMITFANSFTAQSAMDFILDVIKDNNELTFEPRANDNYSVTVRLRQKDDNRFIKKLKGQNFDSWNHGIGDQWNDPDLDILSGVFPYMIWMSDSSDNQELQRTTPIEEFTSWLLRHPWYHEIHAFWGELSEGLEINRVEFTKAMTQTLLKFVDKNAHTQGAILGTSQLDAKNSVTLRDALWQTDPDEDYEEAPRSRTLVCRFKATGADTFKAFTTLKTWDLHAEGFEKGFSPSHYVDPIGEHVELGGKGPAIVVGEDPMVVKLVYPDIPIKQLYFTYGAGNTAYVGKQYTQIAFRGTNPGAPEEKAKQIFADLDVAMSNGVSRLELIPSSGESVEAAGQSMLRFPIPLAHIQEITPDPYKTIGNGDQEMKVIRIKANRQFASDEPWKRLKLALNPEWKCQNPDAEEIQLCMLPGYWELWKTVIVDCQMERPQEWVRYFDGGYMEHPYMKGLYMRHGYGVQRWPNGQVYVGNWNQHVYHDSGTLWAKLEDWREAVAAKEGERMVPVYDGAWKHGNRHGFGRFHFEQDLQDFSEKKSTFSRTQHSGVKKSYEGDFKDGLFHGKGLLVLKGASSQALPTNTTTAGILKKIPHPQVHPTKILRFEGRFESDWQEVYKEFIEEEYDPHWIRTHGHNKEGFRSDNTLALQDQGDFDLMEVEPGEPFPQFYSTLRLEEMTLPTESEKEDAGKYRRYFEKDHKDGAQKAGQPIPDLALAFYALKINGVPNDCRHMVKGTALYADGTKYKGNFQRGWPHTREEEHGEMSQYEEGSQTPSATYAGQWNMGRKSGQGTYEILDNLKYEGQWGREEGLFDKRHGHGHQIIKERLQAHFGYVEYDGEWVKDKRHGHGVMTIPKDPTEDGFSKYEYEGGFQDGLRHGIGFMKYEGSHDILYNGSWKEDFILATDESPAWSHHGTSVYYGALTPDGDRKGSGILYDMKALENEMFHAALMSAQPFMPEADAPHRYKLYEGHFDKNLPNGEGTQYCVKPDGKRLGEYKGQFLDGQRHGRGIWDGVDTKGQPWKYRPIPGTAHNWSKDKMHGIAIVEDAKHVHENVIYTNNTSQMPWTKEGPPTTGFSADSALGKIFAGRVHILSSAAQRENALAIQTQAVSLREGVRRKNEELGNVDLAAAEEGEAAAILVRQPTDLNMPEEDVKVDGGRDENKVLNGVYFKMSGTFGVPIYKNTKIVRRGVMGQELVSYFLYQDIKKDFWLISHSPANDTVEKIMSLHKPCMMVEANAPHPGTIAKPWFVWHADTSQLRVYTDNEEDPDMKKKIGFFRNKDMRLVDKMMVQSVVGFEITGLSQNGHSGAVQSLMLRHPSLFYSRPVYESENGGQFLYWRKKDGSVEEGLTDIELLGPGEIASQDEILIGHWIISTEVGLGIEKQEDGSEGWHPSVIAYVQDSSFTPEQIHPIMPVRSEPEPVWLVRDHGADNEFTECRLMKLKIEEWSHEAASDLNMLDGEIARTQKRVSAVQAALEDGSPTKEASFTRALSTSSSG